MNTWFTSDLHLGHVNILRLCDRPFQTVAEMDNVIISNWNTRVRPDDDVWCLGDFCFRNAGAASNYLTRLSGRKHLIWGNHDSPETRSSPEWCSSQAMAEISVDSIRLVLCHYSMRVWPGGGIGVLHLYGHSHGRLPGNSRCCDVGVDVPFTDFAPVSLEEIQTHLATMPPCRKPEVRLG